VLKRDPRDVLGVDPDASPALVKAAWRRLARRHHPDLIGNDAAAARIATRKMAEINAAYQELQDSDRQGSAGAGTTAERGAAGRSRSGGPGGGPPAGDEPGQGGGPPRPRPGRPVTARVDTSDTFTPRNQTTNRGGGRVHSMPGQPPLRQDRQAREPLRASDPTGPLRRGQVRGFRRPPAPSMTEARAQPVEFGKFRGHTLGEIASFEPSYIDWISGTITRDPELVAAARVIRDDLDSRGIVRRQRATRPGSSRA
jgi:curved DNA-binding protein CbpA